MRIFRGHWVRRDRCHGIIALFAAAHLSAKRDYDRSNVQFLNGHINHARTRGSAEGIDSANSALLIIKE
jgi:hypothetical protein